MELHERVVTVRTSVALSQLDHVHYLRLRGEGAHEVLDRVFPRKLYIRDGQLVQSVLLDEEAHVFADCYLGSDEDEFFLLAEGPEPADLLAYFQRHGEGIHNLEILDTSDYRLIGLDGPYSWELIARMVGQEVIGLPYLTFFYFDGMLCSRAGKTGEYGYFLIMPLDRVEEVREELIELGRPLDIGEADLDALDLCAPESWFFNIRQEGRGDVTPLELQLQWRVSRRKPFVGSEALTERRKRGIRRRLTTLVGEGTMGIGEEVTCGGSLIGEVVNAAFSPAREDWVALALLDLEYAFPGITTLRVGAEGTGARSVSPPVLDNRSLYVNPQVNSYSSRQEDDFPPIVKR